MGKGEVECFVVGLLHPLCDRIASCLHLVGFDDQHLQERYHGNRQEERHHEVDGDGDGEVFQTVVEHALHRDEEGIEDGADTDGSQHHRHEVLFGGVDGGLFGFVALA